MEINLKLPLYEYQKEGVAFLTESGGRAILADAPGVGKTAQALAYIVKSNFERVLVVAPASVKYSWELEVKKWTKLRCVVIDGKTDFMEIKDNIQVWIINYDLIFKFLPQLTRVKFDCLVGDEAQYIKSIKAKRTAAFRRLSYGIKSVLLLTGTPLLSRPSELFSLLNVIEPAKWRNFFEYARYFCAARMTKWGWDYSGTSHPEELHERIKHYFIRRKKEEVLKELPPKVFVDVPVEMPKSIHEEYRLAERDFARYLSLYTEKPPKEIAKTMQAEKLARLNALRQICSRGKVDAAIELIEDLVDSGEKVLVFCTFNEPLDIIFQKFSKTSVMITGRTNVSDRGDLVKVFQSQKDIKIFLGGTLSAGTGITLTAATSVVFLDMAWNPSQMVQASDRLHRPGQMADSVSIYQLYVPKSVDEEMKEILDYKQEVFDKIIEGKVEEHEEEKRKTAQDIMIERIKQRNTK
jgi:SWI/SNF-related matrix-associated actin-dependent regulator 1 of chromatin subfamily A